MASSRRVVVVLAAASALAGGCSLITSLDGLGIGVEAGADGATDTPMAPDTLGDGGVDGATDGGDLSNLTRWSSFDLTMLGGSPTGLWGGTFDGQYVYLTPSADFVTSEVIYRYDTHQSFGAAVAWSKLDLSTTNVGASDFAGAAFDGRFVYLAPTWGATVTARYDTLAPFTQTSSWTLFDGGAPVRFREGQGFRSRFG